MNPWVFFGLLVAFLALVEFVPVETAEPESGQPRWSSRRVRLIEAGFYVVVLAACAGWWFGYAFASFVLGIVFIVSALAALLCVLSWLGGRFH